MVADIFGMDFIWVLVVVVVLFGGSQLPKLAKNAGEAMKELRKVHDEASDTAQSFAGQSPASVASQALAPPGTALAPPPVMPSAPQPGPVAGGPATGVTSPGQVTLSRAELDALLAVGGESVVQSASDRPAT